jgi:hypothetical protein
MTRFLIVMSVLQKLLLLFKKYKNLTMYINHTKKLQ